MLNFEKLHDFILINGTDKKLPEYSTLAKKKSAIDILE